MGIQATQIGKQQVCRHRIGVSFTQTVVHQKFFGVIQHFFVLHKYFFNFLHIVLLSNNQESGRLSDLAIFYDEHDGDRKSQNGHAD